ncbi:hypothetical protein [Paenibacillus sp. FJAT-26967]|uniref:hypothetical protein n=1 Tax=Paenibacillus sp. FJAT-26967 TaxID=1729690 RepID=UPI000838BBF3|nr:hypothetical protein [Paenibacillus sp. FJAT-26967]
MDNSDLFSKQFLFTKILVGVWASAIFVIFFSFLNPNLFLDITNLDKKELFILSASSFSIYFIYSLPVITIYGGIVSLLSERLLIRIPIKNWFLRNFIRFSLYLTGGFIGGTTGLYGASSYFITERILSFANHNYTFLKLLVLSSPLLFLFLLSMLIPMFN